MTVWEKYGITETTLKKVELAIISAPSLRDESYWKRVKRFLKQIERKEYSLTLSQRNWIFNILADLGKMENERARNRNL